jgi:hypothetical protein
VTWNRALAAQAVADVLAGVDETVAVFASPPSTFNPPVYIVGYPRTVTYDHATFSTDLAELPVLVGCGVSEIDRVDELAEQAKKAINADPSCGGAVQHVRVASQDNWRILSVSGVDVLAVDLTLNIRM